MTGLLGTFLPQLRGLLGERAVARVLKRHSAQVANDLILPDGRGGLTQIDHLALTSSAILVIETKHYSGLILGRQHEPQWTQMLGRRRYAFQNPLRQNHGHIKAVQALIPHLPVEGHVVFVGGARFPKGRPPGVDDLAALERALTGLGRQTIPLALQLAWNDLIAQARRDRQARREHLASVKARRHRAGASTRPSPASQINVPGSPAGLRIALAGLLSLAVLGVLLHSVSGSGRSPPAAPSAQPRSAPSAPVARVPQPRQVTTSTRAHLGDDDAQPSPIRWSSRQPHAVAKRQCHEAQAAVLIANTPSNRRRCDQACAPFAAGEAASSPAEMRSSEPATVVAGPWKRLYSAGELTPN
jgi:hypothetical protein